MTPTPGAMAAGEPGDARPGDPALIDLWLTDLGAGEASERDLEGVGAAAGLDAGEIARVRQYATFDAAAGFLAGRRFLRATLGERLGIPPAAVRFVAGPLGKPLLADVPGTAFSFSRSGRWAGCTISAQPVGLDLERLASIPDWRAVGAMVLSRSEQERVARSPDPAGRGFLGAWTCYEAVIKAAGLGLRATDVGMDRVGDRWQGLVNGVAFVVQTYTVPPVSMGALPAPRAPVIVLSIATSAAGMDVQLRPGVALDLRPERD